MSPPPPDAAPSTRVPVAVAPGHHGPLRTIGNVLWLVLAGLWMAIAYVIAGVVQCITVIGIPFGIAVVQAGRPRASCRSGSSS